MAELQSPIDAHEVQRALVAVMSTLESTPAVAREAPARLRMLVVVDSAADFEQLVQSLGRQGIAAEATRIEDAAGMRRALADRKWEIVLSDYQLPRFSAREALALVRELRADLPFIIVSSTVGEETAVDALLAGADDYVMKHNLARLGPSIHRSLRMFAERRLHEVGIRRLAAVAENLPGVVLQLEWEFSTAEIRLPYVSEGAMRLFGIEPARLMQEPGSLLSAFHDEDRRSFIEHVEGCAASQAALDWEGRLLRPDGIVRWIAMTATPRPVIGGALLWDGLAIDITALKGTEIMVRTSRERLRGLAAHLERMKEAERAEVAREIHDDIGALLTGAKADASWLMNRLRDDAAAREKVRDLDGLLDEIVNAAKRIAKSLRPAVLDLGIAAAAEWLARDFATRTGVPCDFTCNDEDLELEPVVANTLFRALQEALTNVTRHAHASRVEVQLFAEANAVSLEIRDDGAGLAPDARERSNSFGLRGMAERVGHLGGWTDVSGEPGHGTTVMLSIPRPARAGT